MRPIAAAPIMTALLPAILALTMLVLVAQAAGPGKVNYQGQLKDAAGPFNGTVGMKFEIFSGPTGGAALWTETHPSVTVADGVFNVDLGRFTALGETTFDGTERWLEITVRPGVDPPLTPRRQFMSTPYAMRATVADVALSGGGGGGWTIVGSNLHSAVAGNVGIGTTAPASKLHVQGDAQLTTDTGVKTIELDNNDGDGSSRVSLYNQSGLRTVNIDAEGVANEGSHFQLYNAAGTLTMGIDSEEGVGYGALVNMRNGASQITLSLDADASANSSRMSFFNPAASTTSPMIHFEASDGNGTPSIFLRDPAVSLVNSAIELDARAGLASRIKMRDSANRISVQIDGEESGGGGEINLFRADGTTAIELDSNFEGPSRVRVDVIEVMGGADLSERFDVRTSGGQIEAGMVVSIDPESAGGLAVSGEPYDRRVAGVVSGAGGVRPGMLMGQHDTAADGAHPVALTGRVYCWADAAFGAIEPGDLLTTSATPGHAMAVTDHAAAQGAIIGKAMTALHDGKGLVLVLVSLQ